MFELGLAYGARLGPDNARVLFCLADAERATDIRDDLLRSSGRRTAAACRCHGSESRTCGCSLRVRSAPPSPRRPAS